MSYLPAFKWASDGASPFVAKHHFKVWLFWLAWKTVPFWLNNLHLATSWTSEFFYNGRAATTIPTLQNNHWLVWSPTPFARQCTSTDPLRHHNERRIQPWQLCEWTDMEMNNSPNCQIVPLTQTRLWIFCLASAHKHLANRWRRQIKPEIIHLNPNSEVPTCDNARHNPQIPTSYWCGLTYSCTRMWM